MQNTAWKGFITGVWDKAIDVRDFIQRNYNPYVGADSFLTAPTERTLKLWQEVLRLYDEEKKTAVLLMPTRILPLRCPLTARATSLKN